MNKRDIELSVRNITEKIIGSTDMEVIDVEYVKEGPFKYLKVFLDKPEGITVEDCAQISRILNKKLDEADLINEQYFLEVSSPGVERPFKKEEDYTKNIGNTVEARFFKPIDGKKSVKGILKEKDDESVTINVGIEVLKVDLKDISKINRVLEDF